MSKQRVREPDVFPPYHVRRLLSQLFSPVFLQLLPQLLPRVPTWVKVAFWTLLLANIKAFPLVWHVRVLGAAVAARALSRPSIHPLLPWIRSDRYATTSPGITPRLRLDKVPLGHDIFADKQVSLHRATPDDCDWNGHMSNSCYPRTLDVTRMAFLASRFLRVHFDGAHFALGGCAFTFHREVPFMAKYTIEMSIGGWDEKWLYVIGRHLSPRTSDLADGARGRLKRSKSAQSIKRLVSDVTKAQHKVEEDSRRAASERDGGIEPDEEQRRSARRERERRDNRHDDEKRMLYCTSVSRYCFKADRKTIPPWLVIATSGYGSAAATRTNWDKAEHLRRTVLARVKAEHVERTGRALPRDSFVLGQGYRKGGILHAYDPARKEDEVGDERGLGAWQDRKSWHIAEFEERRVRGLKLIGTLGGLARPSLVETSDEVAFMG